ncbi:MAG: hypothetical protein ACD_34C00454G0003 [uncultured bacterium]|nr:MAG: hypothetical protein ACD_34C00454G0003 [uncultured bacterium]
MHGFILATAVPVITKSGDHIHTKIPLTFFVIRDVQETVVNYRFAGDGFQKLNLLRTQFAEDILHFLGLESGFEIIEQRIIDMVPRLEEISILAAKFNHFLEVRSEEFKVVICFGFFPNALAGCGFFRKFCDPLR